MPRWVATHKASYGEGCKLGGKPIDINNWRVAKSIFVAADEATARNYARGTRSPYVHYYNPLFTKLVRTGRSNLFKEDPDMADSALTLDMVLGRCVSHGTPAQVAEQLLEFRAEVGPFGTLLYAGHDWADPGLAKTSMRLMAEDVMPMVNRHIGHGVLAGAVS